MLIQVSYKKHVLNLSTIILRARRVSLRMHFFRWYIELSMIFSRGLFPTRTLEVTKNQYNFARLSNRISLRQSHYILFQAISYNKH